MRDSYERFFSEGYITKQQFFDFGLKETIYSPLDRAEEYWQIIKNNALNNKAVYMRGFGRNSNGTHLFQSFYAETIKNCNVRVDPTNNSAPTKVIRDLTGYSKAKSNRHEPIRNYQVSHVFGRTKNIFAFTAPWNIVYTPKMLDPLTGHEAKGEFSDEYQKLFQQQGFQKFEMLINDFNNIITDERLLSSIDEYLSALQPTEKTKQADIEKLKKSIKEEFSPIECFQ